MKYLLAVVGVFFLLGSLSALTIETTSGFPTKTEMGVTASAHAIYAELNTTSYISYYYVRFPALATGTRNTNTWQNTFSQRTAGTYEGMRLYAITKTELINTTEEITDEENNTWKETERTTRYTANPTLGSVNLGTQKEYLLEIRISPQRTARATTLPSGSFNISFAGLEIDPDISAPTNISGSGYYDVVNDITAVAIDLIRVGATGVTLDLNQHTLTCAAITNSRAVNLLSSGTLVRNGTIMDCARGLAVSGGDRNTARDLKIISTRTNGYGIYFDAGSENNTFINITANITGSGALAIYGTRTSPAAAGASWTNITDCNLTGNSSTLGTIRLVNITSLLLSNSTVSCAIHTGKNCLGMSEGTNNNGRYYNNTVIGQATSTLVYIGTTSSGNIFAGNNFTGGGGFSTGGNLSNSFNGTFNGQDIGNLYPSTFPLTWNSSALSTAQTGWHFADGALVPLNDSFIYWSGSAQDFKPMTTYHGQYACPTTFSDEPYEEFVEGKTWVSASLQLANKTDGEYAFVHLNPQLEPSVSDYLKGTSSPFSLPSTATVQGIWALITRNASKNATTGRVKDNLLVLVKGGTVDATESKADTATYWGITTQTIPYGGMTDLWGNTWAYTDINSGFGAALSVASSGTQNAIVNTTVDSICLVVAYNETEAVPNTPPNVTSITVNGTAQLIPTLYINDTWKVNATITDNDSATLSGTVTVFKNGSYFANGTFSGFVANSTATVYNHTEQTQGNYTYQVCASDGAIMTCANSSVFSRFAPHNLTIAGQTYALNENVSASGVSGFNVQADNITLNCAGHSIVGDNTSETAGVSSIGRANTTIRNCVIPSFHYGTKFSGSGSSVDNSTISASHKGVDIWGDNHQISNSSISGNISFSIMDGNNNIIAGNILNTPLSSIYPNCWFSVFVGTTSNNSVYSNKIINHGVAVVEGASGNTFYLNNFSGNGIYVNDTVGGNYYNSTEGNIYENVQNGSVAITGTVASSIAGLYIGTAGSEYPYNNSTSQGKFVCSFAGCGDFAPLTPYIDPSNSCTYGGTGDWVINMADNCNLSVTTDLGANYLVFNGSGTATFNNQSSTFSITARNMQTTNVGGRFLIFIKSLVKWIFTG